MAETQFQTLEQKIDDLISLCTELNQENVGLKADAVNWRTERDHLVSKNETAQNRVETIIGRLKAMEQAS
jgi:cell division protein ZapB